MRVKELCLLAGKLWQRVPYKKKVIFNALLGFASSSLLLLGPYLSQLYIDKSFPQKDLTLFLKLTIVGAGVFFFSTVCRLFADILKKKTLMQIKLDLGKRFIKKFYTLDLTFFQTQPSGEYVYRASDVETVSKFIAEDIPSIIVSACKLIVLLPVALIISFRLTSILVFLSPFFLLQSLYLRKKIRRIFTSIWELNAKLMQKIEEGISHILIIKTLRLEAFQRRQYINTLIKNIRSGMREFRWLLFGSVSAELSSKVAYGLISLYGGWMIIQGRLTLGTYASAMLYIAQIGGVIQLLSNSLEQFTHESISFDKFFEIIEKEPAIKDVYNAQEIKSVKKEIAFVNLTFGYDAARPVFRSLNFTIPACVWVGIAGPSGIGKTTLVNLLLHFFETQKGHILIDGVDTRNITQGSLRSCIVVIAQEPLLFNLSLKENIICGLGHVEEDKFLEAVRMVRLDELTKHLPLGYDSLIGDGGCFLAQGYKQRVALARAIIRDPSVLILDEATSSIDSVMEGEILDSLRTKRAGKTTVLISHRLSTLNNASMVYFFNTQEGVEQGTHQALLNLSQNYRRFFQDQLARADSPPAGLS